VAGLFDGKKSGTYFVLTFTQSNGNTPSLGLFGAGCGAGLGFCLAESSFVIFFTDALINAGGAS